jgi:hypothetical protein
VLLGLLLGGCPNPGGAFDDFAGRIPDAAVVVQPDVPPFETIPDVSGTYLTGLTNTILAGAPGPIQLLSTQTVDKSSGKYMLSVSLQPLDKDTRLPVGPPIPYAPVEVAADGTFDASILSLTIPKEANTLTPVDIVADHVVIHGQILGEYGHCGTLSGNVTAPPIGKLEDLMSTYGAIRVAPGTTGTNLPPPAKSCATTTAPPDAGP